MPAWATASSRWAIVLVLLCVGPALAQRPESGEDDSAAFVTEGRAALRKRDYRGAAKALDEALRLNPRRLEAYVLRSAVYAAQKQYTAGVTLMRRAQALAPDDLDVLTALGSQLVLSGQAAEGVPILQKVIERAPDRYDAQLLLGQHWHAQGAWPEAVTAYEAYFAKRPRDLADEDPEHQVELADSYLRARQPAKALGLFERASARRPRDLRAKVGVAWAMAAIDCRRARPLLADLRPVADGHPEIWLVDGQCALALKDVPGALELGRRYLQASPKASAAGHALVGEAEAARGDHAAAKASLRQARKLEPTRRRFSVRLAHVLRRGGDPNAALAELETIGPPVKPSVDPDWWAEVGEIYLAKGDPAGAVTRLEPVIAGMPQHGGVQTVYGEALARVGRVEVAIAPLELAAKIESTPRSRRWLAFALADVGTTALGEGDAATADTRLTRAAAVDPSPTVWRNLGIARLLTGGDAVGPLEKAVANNPDPQAYVLLGRAREKAKAPNARAAYTRALELARAATLVDVSIDVAAFELASGEPAAAVAALERAGGGVKLAEPPLAQRYKAALITARHAAGLAALRAGNGDKAVDYLAAAAAAAPDSEDYAIRCDLAVASVVAGDREPALKRLRAVAAKPCPFPAPADVQAVPILIAFVEGRQEKRATKALARLQAIDAKASGPIKALAGTAIRVVAMEAADDAYRSGRVGQARKLLADAKRAQSRAGADELVHNQAVIDIADGRLDAAISALDKLAPKLPEALVNIGVAYDRQGNAQKALDTWRKARRAGARFGPLSEWIAAKEQIYGGEQ